MAPGEYTSTSSGKLKLKGVKDSKVDKKKKKSSSSSRSKHDVGHDGEDAEVENGASARFKDRSVVLKRLEEEDQALAREEGKAVTPRRENLETNAQVEEERGEVVKTEAERRYEEQRRRRVRLTTFWGFWPFIGNLTSVSDLTGDSH